MTILIAIVWSLCFIITYKAYVNNCNLSGHEWTHQGESAICTKCGIRAKKVKR